jgi:extracellular factor (EF) 3-hydroxypalmitic acid methyl ester biosynthesis protein
MNVPAHGSTRELDKNIIGLTEEITSYLREIKQKLDQFDSDHPSKQDRENYLKKSTPSIYGKLTSHFTQVWNIVKKFNKEEYSLHRKYYQKALLKYFLEGEINKYIYSKPLGYAGDFRMMNYILDYHDKFFGTSSFGMLINHYTCNITISQSNIERKDFFRNKIREVAEAKSAPRITSFGGGPLRELIELLSKNQINVPLQFFNLDLEPKAIDYAKGELEKIEDAKKSNLTIEHLNINIKDLLRSKVLMEQINKQDFIYISGVFDYLSDRFCSRILQVAWELLRDDGEIIVCNANKDGKSLRAYFEFLGEWEMNFRTDKHMLKWIEGLGSVKNVDFGGVSANNEYLFMTLRK